MKRAVLALSIALGLVACRTDLYAPGETVDTSAPVGPYRLRPWTPAIRVIEGDGSIRPTVHAMISNRDHYPFEGPGSEFVDGLDWSSDDPAGVSLLPPIDLELVPPGSSELREWIGVDFVPAPGDTIVIDLRPTTHVLVVDVDTPAQWRRDTLWLSFRGEHGFDSDLAASPRFTRNLRFGPTATDSFAITLPPQTDGLVRARLIWSAWDEDSAVSVQWTPALGDADPWTSDEIRIAGEVRRSWIRLVRDGRPIPRSRVRIHASTRSQSFAREYSYTDERHVRAEAVPVWWIGDEVEVSVRCEADRPWFLEQVFDVPVVGDTMVVDVGPLDLEVEVTDTSGRPEAEASVSVRRPATFLVGAEVRADLAGRASFAVVADVYRITARRPLVGGATSEVDTLIHVTADALVRLELPE